MQLKTQPRLYQESIFANCASENTLVILPTGLGKTMIALMMTLHYISKGKILILAPTKPLIEQHMKSFLKDSDIQESDCALMTGASSPKEREEQYARKIIFATPQTIRNDIITRKILLSDYSLIVYDECHRASGDYAYNFIASQYKGRAMGLSASPGSDDDKIKEVCRNLNLTRIESRTERDPDVKKYIHEKKINELTLELPDDLKEVMKYLKRSQTVALKELKDEGAFPDRELNKIFKRDLLMMQGATARTVQTDNSGYRILSLTAKALKVNHALELMQTQGLESLRNYFEEMKTQTAKAAKELIREHNFQQAMQLAFNTKAEHPKYKALIDLIKNDKTYLVFTQYRETANLITRLINDNGGKAKAFIGQKNGMSQKEQLITLQEFREGKFNTLVSTSVSEEGIDIPLIDAAVFFEPVPSALRTVQRMGRVGRAKTGEVYVLITNGTIDEKYKWVAHYKEKRMKEAIQRINTQDLKQPSLNNFLK